VHRILHCGEAVAAISARADSHLEDKNVNTVGSTLISLIEADSRYLLRAPAKLSVVHAID
jgi:hypothetical protein